MKRELLQFLSCPECKGQFSLVEEESVSGEIKKGRLSCCGKSYEISNFIPRFIDSDEYVGSFSFEWKTHSRTQLDSANSNNRMSCQSRIDFQKRLNFPLSELKDKLVLDVGCGMWRFSEIAVSEGANLIGVDLSFSVDVAIKNIGIRNNVNFLQADIFRLPLKEGIFDLVYSFGVL